MRVVVLLCLLFVASPVFADPPRKAASGKGDPKLKRGDRGDGVRILQHLLNDVRRANGQSSIGVDGAFGPQTAGAVRDYQRLVGVFATGQMNVPTWRALHKSVAQGPLGFINPIAQPVAADRYDRRRGSGRDVSLHLLPEIQTAPTKRAQPILFESKMSIDADGAGNAWRSDPWGQPATSLQYRGGRSLDPTIIPYFVLPIGFDARHRPHMRLGDVAAVIYRDRVAYAIYGDRGPRTRIGEGSIKLAQELGINASPTHGGVSAGVFYIVFPGSGNRRPLSVSEIRRRGAMLLRRCGGKP